MRLARENATAKRMRSLLMAKVFKDNKPSHDGNTGKNLSQIGEMERNLEHDGDSYRMLQHPPNLYFDTWTVAAR